MDKEGIISETSILSNLRMLFWCQNTSKMYTETVETYNKFTEKLSEKQKYSQSLAEFMGIAYYGVHEYNKSLDFFSKARYFFDDEQVIEILKSDGYKPFNKKRKKLLDKTLFSYIESKLITLSLNDDNQVEKISKWLKKHDAVDAKDESGNPHIYYAMKKDNAEIVKLLIKSGADVNYKNENGMPLIVITGFYDSPKTMKLLIKYVPDVNIKSDGGWTALHSAASNGHTDTCKILLSAGLSPEERPGKSKKGYFTPIYAAMEKKHDDIVNLFIKHGISKDILDEARKVNATFDRIDNKLDNIERALKK